MAKKKAIKKAARPDKTAARASSASKVARKVVKKKPAAKPVAAKPPAARKPIPAPAPAPAPKPPVVKVPVVVAEPEPENPARKKGVRKATITTGIRDAKPVRKLGRSRIPVDAPLDVVLEQFNPDDLVLRLTGPAKLTVGRIRKILAMNNRCLTGDEEFALEFQELLSRPRE